MAGIPLSDDYPVRRVPVVTYTLIAVNVAVYLLSPMSLLAVWYGAPESRGCAIEGVPAAVGRFPRRAAHRDAAHR